MGDCGYISGREVEDTKVKEVRAIGVAFMSAGTGLLAIIISTDLQNSILLALGLFCLIIGIIILLWSLTLKDEPDEIEVKKLELDNDKLELEGENLIFSQIKEKTRLTENKMKVEHEKIEKVYKPIKKSLRLYLDEIGIISNSPQKNINDTTHSQLLSKLQHESLLLTTNPEDSKLLMDMNILWRLAGEILSDTDKHCKEEMSPVIIEIMERIEYKISNPSDSYGDYSTNNLDEWWEHWQNSPE